MKKTHLLAAATLLLTAAACAESPAGPSELVPMFTQDVSGPLDNVTGVYVKQAGTGTFANTHPQNRGSCDDNGVWYNQNGQATGAAFCQRNGGAGTSVTCTFGALATYARGSDNQNLNFNAPEGVDLYVHYKSNHNQTEGKGTLAFTASCDDGINEAGTLAMNQFTAEGNLFLDDSTLSSGGVAVVTDTGTYLLTGLTWINRSGVGN